jgi:hypothetical protein
MARLQRLFSIDLLDSRGAPYAAEGQAHEAERRLTLMKRGDACLPPQLVQHDGY